MKNDHYRQSLVPFHEILSSTSTRRARRSDATTFERSKRILSTLSMTGFILTALGFILTLTFHS